MARSRERTEMARKVSGLARSSRRPSVSSTSTLPLTRAKPPAPLRIPQVPSKRKWLLDDEPDPSSDADSKGQDSEVADDPEEYEDDPGVQMSVEEALHDPLYIISIQPDMRGCIICPRKLLKNDAMASVHMKSQVCRIHSTTRYRDLMTPS